MRILQINKYFNIHGGADTVFFDTINALKEDGQEVAEFSMEDPNNKPSDFSRYFVSGIPTLRNISGISNKIKAAKRFFSSKEVEEKLTALVKDFKPEVAHIHNAYRELSASTYTTLKKLNIPIVQTLHDVFPLCPNHSLLNGETMGEDVFKNKTYNCIRYKCVNNQLLPSVLGTVENYYYRLRRIWDMVDLFICPSQFMKDKFVEYGFPAEKMRVIMHPRILPKSYPPLGNTILYLGRIHYERGIKVFMKAAQELKEYPIVIAGSGSDDLWVDNFIKENQLANIKRLGWLSGEESKLKVLAQAKVVVAPAIFFDVCSLSILEALSYGRIVVATDRGGNPELVINGQTGFLAKPEDPADLARAIKEAMSLPKKEAEKMGENARKLVEQNHSTSEYVTKVKSVYRELILA